MEITGVVAETWKILITTTRVINQIAWRAIPTLEKRLHVFTQLPMVLLTLLVLGTLT